MAAITEAEALERIARMTAATYEPVLEEGDLADLVELAKRSDRYGVLPDDDAWVPTWDLNYAAAEGWSIKAARASSDFTYSDDAGSYNRREVYDMCADREKHYRSRALGSLPVSKHDPDDVIELAP